MNLQRVSKNTAYRCRLICKRCSSWRMEENCYADLEDKPGSYYCQDCAKDIAPNRIDASGELKNEST